MVQARKEMQALVSEDMRDSLFGFEGADKKRPPSGEEKAKARKLSLHTALI